MNAPFLGGPPGGGGLWFPVIIIVDLLDIEELVRFHHYCHLQGVASEVALTTDKFL